jgi:hypothetical protein
MTNVENSDVPKEETNTTSSVLLKFPIWDLLPFGNFYPSHSAPLVAYINILTHPKKHSVLEVEQEKPNFYNKRSLRKADIDTVVTERQFCWCYISE